MGRVPVDSPQRFLVETQFSPGANYDPFSLVPLHPHVMPVVPRTPPARLRGSPARDSPARGAPRRQPPHRRCAFTVFQMSVFLFSCEPMGYTVK